MVWQKQRSWLEAVPLGGGGHVSPLLGRTSTTQTDKLVVSGCSSCSFSWRRHSEQRVAFGSYREQLYGCVCKQ